MNSAELVLLASLAFLLVPCTEQIRGGFKAYFVHFPWHAEIFRAKYETQRVCGGTLVTDRFVLTAEVCVTNCCSADVFVAFYVAEESTESSIGYTLNVSKIHKSSSSSEALDEALSNVALLELDATTTSTTDEFVPVCIDQTEILVPGQFASVPGPSEDRSMEAARLPVVSSADCLQSKSKLRAFLNERTICAGYDEDDTGICHGDVGAGLVFERNGSWFIGAVALFRLHRNWPGGRLCSASNDYSVFLNIHDFVPWVKKVTNLESSSEKCGYRNFLEQVCGTPRDRIDMRKVAGTKATPGNWPWYAAVYHRKDPNPPKYVCGATLISGNYVVTARQCTLANGQGPQLATDELSCRIGIDEHRSQPDLYPVVGVYHSPYANFEDIHQSGVSLLRLQTKVRFTDEVVHMCESSEYYSIPFLVEIGPTEEPAGNRSPLIMKTMFKHENVACKLHNFTMSYDEFCVENSAGDWEIGSGVGSYNKT